MRRSAETCRARPVAIQVQMAVPLASHEPAPTSVGAGSSSFPWIAVTTRGLCGLGRGLGPLTLASPQPPWVRLSHPGSNSRRHGVIRETRITEDLPPRFLRPLRQRSSASAVNRTEWPMIAERIATRHKLTRRLRPRPVEHEGPLLNLASRPSPSPTAGFDRESGSVTRHVSPLDSNLGIASTST